MKKRLLFIASTACVFGASTVHAADNEVQDMSDPLAIYTQVGGGVTNKGLNLKVGKTYDTGKENVAGMNVLEVKGIAGDTLGWHDDPQLTNDSVDSFRIRNFTANLKNGRGAQIDLNYDLNKEFGSASYSFIQALPKLGPLQLFPLAGAGVAFGNNVIGDDGHAVSGYSVPGTFALVGTYTKLELTDHVWLNYNPMYMATLSGSDTYKHYGLEANDSVLTHEFAISYQIIPRFNVRYFANWTENTRFSDGDHRIEFNYQL
ncbi:hypothetical protein [Vibrio sinaloensis]|uniref:hypothetical protein n=1 Tax=Photobacterium sp. (strain ATCC 43367) TaxID=379097 RepID=UPI002046B6F9|nr:hypothetical protein [Vibrio sinaloensis]UPQ88974.1 hypothetical protein MTO69_05440 [Vibrio sinaloensis]